MKKKITVGIVSYNAPEYVKLCLDSLLAVGDARVDIWVYDNASEEETVELLEGYHSKGVNLLLSNRNKGYGYALNRIIERTEDDYFVCMNSDIEVKAGWLDPMIDMCERDKAVGAVQPKMINQDGKLMGCGVGGTNAKRYIRGWMQEDVGQFDKPLESVSICGACMVVPRKVFETVGTFDERFAFYFEESITADRFVTVKNKDGLVEIKNIEEFFNENCDLFGECKINEYEALSVSQKPHIPKDFSDINFCSITEMEYEISKMYSLGLDSKQISMLLGILTIKVENAKRRVEKRISEGVIEHIPEWTKIKRIIRHKPEGRKIFRILDRWGETITTQDHSLIGVKNGEYIEVKPENASRLESIRMPVDVKQIDSICLSDFMPDNMNTNTKDGCRSKKRCVSLEKEDGFFTYKSFRKNDKQIYILDKVLVGSKEMSSLCRLIGAYVAEGSCSNRVFSITSTNRMWLDKLFEDILTISNCEPCIVSSNNKSGTIQYTLVVARAIFSILFLELCGAKGFFKRLPNFVYHIGKKHQREILDKMIEGDGCRIKKGKKYVSPHTEEAISKWFMYTTVSLELCCNLSLILNQLNIKHRINKGKRFGEYNIVRQTKLPSKRNTFRIEEVEYNGYVYDLELEGGSHIFVDSCGSILLHNTSHHMECRKAGYKVMYCPASSVIHYWDKSPKKNNPLVENAFKNGERLFNEKHSDMMADEREY